MKISVAECAASVLAITLLISLISAAPKESSNIHEEEPQIPFELPNITAFAPPIIRDVDGEELPIPDEIPTIFGDAT